MLSFHMCMSMFSWQMVETLVLLLQPELPAITNMLKSCLAFTTAVAPELAGGEPLTPLQPQLPATTNMLSTCFRVYGLGLDACLAVTIAS